MSHLPQLVYLHGFLSSPRSAKARQTVAYCRQHGMRGMQDIKERVHVPALHCGPRQAVALIDELVDRLAPAPVMYMGSSLGGFYAGCMARRHRAPAVLINPAVRPHEYWRSYIGSHRSFHSERMHEVTPAHIAELQQLEEESEDISDNLRVFLQTGDETLDYRRAVDKYGADCCVVRPGGSHSYDDFTADLPQMLRFLLSRIKISGR